MGSQKKKSTKKPPPLLKKTTVKVKAEKPAKTKKVNIEDFVDMAWCLKFYEDCDKAFKVSEDLHIRNQCALFMRLTELAMLTLAKEGL